MIKSGTILAILILLFLAAAPAPALESYTIKDVDTGFIAPHHEVSLDPISLLVGSLGGGYEYHLGQNGFLLEGSYSLPILQKAYYGMVSYRYYFKPGAQSMFLGPFIKRGFISQKIQDPTTRNEFEYSMPYTSAGISLGSRKYLWRKHAIFYSWRLGLGYPIMDITWQPNRPAEIGGMSTSTFEKITRISGYLDGKLAINYLF